MPAYGQPGRGGESYGGAEPRVSAILRSLLQQMGGSLDVEQGTTKWYHALALAQSLASAWDAGAKVANQFVWERLSFTLPRWRKIFNVYVPAETAEPRQRALIAARWAGLGTVTTRQAVADVLAAQLVDVPFSTVRADYTNGYVAWPFAPTNAQGLDGGPKCTIDGLPDPALGKMLVQWQVDGAGGLGVATFQWAVNRVVQATGVVTAANVALGATGLTVHFAAGARLVGERYFSEVLPDEWMSTYATVVILVPKPDGMDEKTYTERVASASDALDRLLPGHGYFYFVRDSLTLGAGFWLDQDRSLDNMRFDSSETWVAA